MAGADHRVLLEVTSGQRALHVRALVLEGVQPVLHPGDCDLRAIEIDGGQLTLGRRGLPGGTEGHDVPPSREGRAARTRAARPGPHRFWLVVLSSFFAVSQPHSAHMRGPPSRGRVLPTMIVDTPVPVILSRLIGRTRLK